jgi:hypothetical protein
MWNVATNMSEFKYACPVCGQHMKCDSSQTGSVTDCPTCFQKIIVPQAPADADQKLILTGTQVGVRPAQKTPEANPYAATQVQGSSGALVVVIILLFIGTAAAFIYRGTIFKSKPADAAASQVSSVTNENPAPAKPVVIAPPANDTNWLLTLGTNAIPDSPAAGRIHGQNFIVDRAYIQNGILTLRNGTRGPVTFGITINFSGALAEALAGKKFNILADTNKAARVTLRWQNDADSGKESFDDSYAMRLEFGALANNRLPGSIYLCTPDEGKSYLVGTFNAEARKPRPKKPQQ